MNDPRSIDTMARGFIDAALWADCEPAATCPDCGQPITLNGTGWWSHDGLAGDCWRVSMDGPGDVESGGCEGLSADADLQAFAVDTCRAFAVAAGRMLDAYAATRAHDGRYSTEEMIGHDLWLSCRGHGTGLWDRDADHGDALHAIARGELGHVEHVHVYGRHDGTATVDR